MITSLFRYPKGDRYIQINQSLLAACDGNACAAALLKFFERWHRYRIQQKEYTSIYNAMASEAGLQPVIDVSGWQYHTYEQLKQGVLIYHEDTIRAALRLLTTKEYLDTEVPDRLRMLHKTGRTQWFLLRADKINEWLDRYELSIRPKTLVFPPRKAELSGAPDKPLPTGSDAETALKVFRYKSARRIEFWKARGKQMREAVPDADTLYTIMKLLDKFKPEELAYAVEGNLASEYHQGKNSSEAVYDDIRKILKDAASVNKFISYAEQNGVNFGAVVARFNNGSGAVPVTQAPEQFAAYHKRLALMIASEILSDYPAANKLRNALEPNVDKSIPFSIELVRNAVRENIEAKHGVFGDTHKHRYAGAEEILLELMK